MRFDCGVHGKTLEHCRPRECGDIEEPERREAVRGKSPTVTAQKHDGVIAHSGPRSRLCCADRVPRGQRDERLLSMTDWPGSSRDQARLWTDGAVRTERSIKSHGGLQQGLKCVAKASGDWEGGSDTQLLLQRIRHEKVPASPRSPLGLFSRPIRANRALNSRPGTTLRPPAFGTHRQSYVVQAPSCQNCPRIPDGPIPP